MDTSRRRFLQALGVLGPPGLAGCLGGKKPVSEEVLREKFPGNNSASAIKLAENAVAEELEKYNSNVMRRGHHVPANSDRDDSYQNPILDLGESTSNGTFRINVFETDIEAPATRYRLEVEVETDTSGPYADFSEYEDGFHPLLFDQMGGAIAEMAETTAEELLSGRTDFRESVREPNNPAIAEVQYSVKDQKGNTVSTPTYRSGAIDRFSGIVEQNSGDQSLNKVYNKVRGEIALD